MEMTSQSKTALFEESPVPEAVMKLAVPTMIHDQLAGYGNL